MNGVNQKYDIIVSEEILQEFKDVLSRPKFKMLEKEINRVIKKLRKSSEIIEIESTFKVVKNDPDDDVIINTAYDGKAQYIVSGDNHLLNLKKFQEIKIISVNEMLKILE